MIIRKRENWFRMLFIWHGSVLPLILPRLIMLALFSSLVYFFSGTFFDHKIALNPTAFTLIGIALAIFLGFCNTAAYDRFWEGRKLWGALLIDCRSLTRQIRSYVKATPLAELQLFSRKTIAVVYALKHQLRDTDARKDLNRLLTTEITGRFVPVLLLNQMAEWLQQKENESKIDSITKMGIDNNLNKISEIIGGCERIATTPIPFSYHVLLHRTVYIYCFLLPFGLVDSIGWMTPVVVTFIGYTFIALDAIVSEISDPFGVEPNDLALDAICYTIEYSIAEMMELRLPPQQQSSKIIAT